MTSLQALRDFINERLTAAAGEIFFVFQQTIVRYEEEVRRNRLLEIDRKIQIKFLKTELQQHRQCREAQRLNQETDYCGEQEDPEPTQIKEEPEEAEPPQIKEEPEEAEPPQIKEEPEVSQLEKQQELSTSQEGEQLILKVESGSFWVPSIEEQSSLSEPKEDPDSEQLVSRDSEVHHVTKHIDSGSTRHVKLKKCSVVLGDHVDEVPESAQQAEGEELLGDRISGENVCKKAKTSPSLGTVTDKKKIICETCGKSFSMLSRLLFHKRTHTGEKPYSCEPCGKSFTQQDSLLRHNRTHTRVKPCTCETCGKCFSKRKYLLVHMRTHRQEVKIQPKITTYPNSMLVLFNINSSLCSAQS